MSATTQKLNYASIPPRATSSRAIRNEVIPSNGSSFKMSDTIIFDLPSNLNNTFADFQSSYVKLTVKNTDGAAVKFNGGGFPSSIRRIVLELGGQTLFSCDNYGTLFEMMMSLDTSTSFRGNAGKRLFGSSITSIGETIATTKSRNICFPLVLTPLMASKYWPLIGRDRLRIRIELDTSVRGLIGAASDAEIEISDVGFVMYNLELGSDVMAQVAAASGGQFKIAMPSFQHHQASLSTSDTGVVATLGFSMSSLNRILVAQQLSAEAAAKNNIGNRSRLKLNRYFLTIGGIKYPMRDIRETGLASAENEGAGAETLAEALISQRALTSWGHDSSVEVGEGFSALEPSGADDANTGSYLIDIDLESQRIAGGESGTGLISGINCIGQVVQLTLEYSGAASAAHVINIYGEFTQLAVLDLNTLSWTLAV